MARQSLCLSLPDEAATLALGRSLYPAVAPGTLVFLRGDLGAGKTTLVRGYLRASGHDGAVKSPTFTVVEEYFLSTGAVYHFDLYRLAEPEELESLGFRDYLQEDAICFVEWPERAAGTLPDPDLDILLAPDGTGRAATLTAASEKGLAVLARLQR